jgi:hypothetical protein
MLEAVLKGLEDVAIPARVLLFEDFQGRFASIVSLEVRVRGVVGDELFAELSHRKRSRVLEACYELAIGSEKQVHAFLLEVVFGELIHCYKYIGTLIGCQAKSALEGHQLWKMTLP